MSLSKEKQHWEMSACYDKPEELPANKNKVKKETAT